MECEASSPQSRQKVSTLDCENVVIFLLSHSLKCDSYEKPKFLKRNNFLTRSHAANTRYQNWRQQAKKWLNWNLPTGTHLIVSGSISFRWFEDAWKMLLLLMFILFSLLHKRIVDIFESANFHNSRQFHWFFHLSIQDFNPQKQLMLRSQCFDF